MLSLAWICFTFKDIVVLVKFYLMHVLVDFLKGRVYVSSYDIVSKCKDAIIF